jgi:hypothetical protein
MVAGSVDEDGEDGFSEDVPSAVAFEARELFRSVAQARRREPQCAVVQYSCCSSASRPVRSTAHGTYTMAVPYSGDDVR